MLSCQTTFPTPHLHLFNHVPEDKPYDRIKYLSIIMGIMYEARLTRPDVLLATTKAQHLKRVTLRIISYLKGTNSHDIVVNYRELKFHLHCNASLSSHHDASSHTAWVLKIGESFFGPKSSKQRGVPIIYRRRNYFYSGWIKNLK